MSDSQALRRFPALIRQGNGISVTYQDGIWTVGANLQNMTITPTGAAAPVNLADTMANLIAQYSGTKNIININDGCYDIPNSGNGYSANDGSF
jgi:hypothetical protein